MITLLIQIITPRIEIENGVRRWKDEATHETVYLQTYKQVIKKFRTNPVILSSIKSKTHRLKLEILPDPATELNMW